MHMTKLDFENARKVIEASGQDASVKASPEYRQIILDVIEALDQGHLRVAEKKDGQWEVQAWVQQAILGYFGVRNMDVIRVGPYEYHDKIPLKKHHAAAGFRSVPPATVRYGAFIEAGAVLMPSYVNIGAYVGAGTMVDTWATVAPCAQVGRNVHLSGGVGLGGVLEPPGSRPVIIEDGAFIGSRCIVVEGTLVEEEAVLGANVVLTSSTRIIDVSGEKAVEYRGRVPARSVVIPGTVAKDFPAGSYQVSCALIIGQRKASTDKKTSLNEALREFNVSI
jgi:2,3,4,5-tetrahydropyridine-2-carboxylate N-succinyltransferase